MTMPMGSTSGYATTDRGSGLPQDLSVHHSRGRRVSDESKKSFRTTEFFVYVVAVLGVLIASLAVGTNSDTGVNGTHVGDYFRADKAWMMITILSVGYMISRGLAKAGTRHYHDEDSNSSRY